MLVSEITIVFGLLEYIAKPLTDQVISLWWQLRRNSPCQKEEKRCIRIQQSKWSLISKVKSCKAWCIRQEIESTKMSSHARTPPPRPLVQRKPLKVSPTGRPHSVPSTRGTTPTNSSSKRRPGETLPMRTIMGRWMKMAILRLKGRKPR